MELNKIQKVKPINISKKLIDIVENKPKVNKKNFKKYILKPKIKETSSLVKIETGPFLIHL